MAQTAAHLVDHVIPPVLVRQWVISVPKRLRGLLADRPAAVAALTKIFLDEIERLLCAAAGLTRAADAPASARARLWFRLIRLLDAAAAADMLAWENSGFSVDASVRITLLDRDVPSYFQSLEHLLRYSARPPFAPPRNHRHRYHGVFAPNHTLRRAVTALAIGNVGKQREATASGQENDGHGSRGCCDANQKPRSHDTSRIAWAKLMARMGAEFPLQCPACGGDIRLIAFSLFYRCETSPGLHTVGNLRLLRTSCPRSGVDPENPHASWRTARAATGVARSCPPTDWGELVQIHDDRDVFQASPDELPAIDIHSL